jgi:hypothetical protein
MAAAGFDRRPDIEDTGAQILEEHRLSSIEADPWPVGQRQTEDVVAEVGI